MAIVCSSIRAQASLFLHGCVCVEACARVCVCVEARVCDGMAKGQGV